MDKRASSSSSHPKTSANVVSSSKDTSSASIKQAQNAWVEENEEALLKAFANWTSIDSPNSNTIYGATEGTEKDLPYTLGLIYEKYGPLKLRYEGCDGLACHWVSGWDTTIDSRSVKKIMMFVEMKKRLPGQSPVLDRLSPSNNTDSDEESNKGTIKELNTDIDEEIIKEMDEELSKGVDEEIIKELEAAMSETINDVEVKDRTDSVEEKNEEKGKDTAYSDEESNEGTVQYTADWVEVSSGGFDDSHRIRPNNVQSIVNGAERFLQLSLEALRKL